MHIFVAQHGCPTAPHIGAASASVPVSDVVSGPASFAPPVVPAAPPSPPAMPAIPAAPPAPVAPAPPIEPPAPELPVDAASGLPVVPAWASPNTPPAASLPLSRTSICRLPRQREPTYPADHRQPHGHQHASTRAIKVSRHSFPIPLCAYQALFTLAVPPLPLTIQGARAIGLDACEAVAIEHDAAQRDAGADAGRDPAVLIAASAGVEVGLGYVPIGARGCRRSDLGRRWLGSSRGRRGCRRWSPSRSRLPSATTSRRRAVC